MREIKFRGLRTDGKGWVYGFYALWQNEHMIFPESSIGKPRKVTPETVGQFTGLKDKNGTNIYEGDVLSCPYWDGENHLVSYDNDTRWTGYWFPKDDVNDIEVISNIHTNNKS